MKHNTLLNRKKAAMSLTPIIMLVVGLIVLLIGIGIVSKFVNMVSPSNSSNQFSVDEATYMIISVFGVFMALGGLVIIAGSISAMTKGLFGSGQTRRRGRRY